MTSIPDVRDMVSRITDPKKLKSALRAEVALQKVLHPFDAKERSYLYKMNFVSAEELAENLIILFDTSGDGEVGQDVHFPTEDEIFELLEGADNREQTCNVEHVEYSTDTPTFSAEQPLAVVWDTSDNVRYWCICFYIRDLIDNEIQVDHLKCKYDSKFDQWIRPEKDDIQPVQRIQILPVDVDGEWDYSKRQPVYHIHNVQDIESTFSDY